MIYNVRNDFDEGIRKKGSDERKYRKKRLHNFIELYGEERIDVENGTAKNLYFDTMRQKNSLKYNIKKSKMISRQV